MKTIRALIEIILESSIKGNDDEKYKNDIIKNFIKYGCEYLGISDNRLTIKYGKSHKNRSFGNINLSEIKNGKNTINIEKNHSFSYDLKMIAHELTHIKQIQKDELELSGDGWLVWKKNKEITIDDYGLLTYEAQRHLGWEQEAYANQESIPNEYARSKQFANLKSSVKDATARFVLDNIF